MKSASWAKAQAWSATRWGLRSRTRLRPASTSLATKQAGLATFEETDTSCCYALQDKVWVTGPGKEPWGVYVVRADANSLDKSIDGPPEDCCGTTACCTPDEQAVDLAQTPTEAKTAAGCSCGS